MLRRVELKNREVTEGDSIWSIRQTAVYQRREPCVQLQQNRIAPVESRSTFLLVSPSKNVELQISEYLDETTGIGAPLSVWNTHRILIADSLRGWMDYMAYLEKRLKHQVSQPCRF
jgi:hypothetical protein